MNLMICMRGEKEDLSFLPEIAEIGGIELQSYGMTGIQSEQEWNTRFALHKEVRNRFQGTIAVHGPFVGIEYAHRDHLIRDVVNRRLDMIFDVAVKLKATRVILHSGFKTEIDLFNLQEVWLGKTVEFWKQEIRRWADAGIMIVIENTVERTPDLLIQLVSEVENPFLKLCMDIGHHHLFSEQDAAEWVRSMGNQLFHIHLHDNDRTGDRHWPIGRGTIDFESFYAALIQYTPQVTISLELEGNIDVRMNDFRKLAANFASKHVVLE